MRVWSFSAEQRDMPDGIAVKDTAARLPNRGRLQKKKKHHNKTIRYDITDHEQDHAEPN